MGRVNAFTLAIPASMAISPRVALVLAALWLLPVWFRNWLAALWHLPDWLQRWLDVRDRWHR